MEQVADERNSPPAAFFQPLGSSGREAERPWADYRARDDAQTECDDVVEGLGSAARASQAGLTTSSPT